MSKHENSLMDLQANQIITQAIRYAVLISMAISCSPVFSQIALNTKPLPALKLAEPITLSGLSSGAYMAGQYHQAFAEEVIGVAMIAAGPVYCAQNNLQHALTHCLANPQAKPDLTEIEQTLSALRAQGLLAPISAVAKSRVWIFSGSADQTVSSEVTAALAAQYANWIEPEQLRFINEFAFAHHFPTALPNLTACDRSEPPFLASCNFDAAGKLLSHLLNKTLTAASSLSGHLYQINQHQLAPASKGQLAELGYAYIPSSCQQGAACQLHVSFHGCRQDASQVGEAYVTSTGLNHYADANHLVILYPQITQSTFNPLGCWDWWGYSGANYLSKTGAQLQAVKQLIDAFR